MIELSSSTGNIVAPVALILSTIRPYLNAEAMSLVGAHFKLTLVDCSVRVNNFFSKLKSFFFQK